MKRKVIVGFCVTLVITVCMIGCTNYKYNQEYPAPVVKPVCDTTNMSFATNIQPILNQYCTTCHNSSGSAAGYGDYTSYGRNLSSYANNGTLVSDITNTDLASVHHMPQNAASLSACQIEQITAWVNEGAPNN